MTDDPIKSAQGITEALWLWACFQWPHTIKLAGYDVFGRVLHSVTLPNGLVAKSCIHNNAIQEVIDKLHYKDNDYDDYFSQPSIDENEIW